MNSLHSWLDYILSIHSKPIDMGLERVEVVKQRLGIDPSDTTVFTVGGTNGKGSCCAMLESILVNSGFKVGTYTSPHLLDFNERARINGANADDATLIQAFEAVEAARTSGDEPVSLTYFEFTTLAIMWIFSREVLDAWILEVGLGGRLDAVNVIDTDCAIISSIDIDHKEFLGDTREAIGREKAGIFRAGKPAIIGDPAPPATLMQVAEDLGADIWLFGRDYNYSGDKQQWAYGGRGMRRAALSYPALRGANQLLNASAVMAALESVRDRLPVPVQAVRQGFLTVELPGRFQVLPGQPTVVLDVGHNPHAAAHLRESLDNMGFYPYTHCIFGMLTDKDAAAVMEQLSGKVDHWHFVSLGGERGRSGDDLAHIATQVGIHAAPFDWAKNAKALNEGGISMQPPDCSAQVYDSVASAYAIVSKAITPNDRILVFGSFVTVAEALLAIRQSRAKALH